MRIRKSMFVYVLLLALAIAGCGAEEEPEEQPQEQPAENQTDEEASEEPEGDATTTDEITIAATAGIPTEWIAFAIDEGYFAEQNLDATLEIAVGGAAIVPGLMSGDYDFGTGSSISYILARHRGLDVQIVTGSTIASQDPMEDFTGVIVRQDSDIEDVADLDGRTVALPTLASVPDIITRFVLEENGVDPNGVQYLEIPFPDMVPALERGDVDAVWILEPFRTLALSQGHRLLTSVAVETKPGLAIGVTGASASYITENPDIVRRFYDGLAAATQTISDDPEAFRAYLLDKEAIPAHVAEDLVLPQFSVDVDRDSLELLADLMARYDMVESTPDLEGLVWEP